MLSDHALSAVSNNRLFSSITPFKTKCSGYIYNINQAYFDHSNLVRDTSQIHTESRCPQQQPQESHLHSCIRSVLEASVVVVNRLVHSLAWCRWDSDCHMWLRIHHIHYKLQHVNVLYHVWELGGKETPTCVYNQKQIGNQKTLSQDEFPTLSLRFTIW